MNGREDKTIKTSFLGAWGKMWTNTFNYKGVASRSEYWIPVLFQTLIGFISIGLVIISFRVGNIAVLSRIVSLVLSAYLLISLIPWISLTVRRLRDAGKSVWWIILVFVIGIGLIILALICTASSIVSFSPALNEPDIVYGPPADDIRYMK